MYTEIDINGLFMEKKKIKISSDLHLEHIEI
jgi:hypothetical protein